MSVMHPFPMSLYWGGKIEYENGSITYDESTTSTATIIIRDKLSYEELVNMIYEHVGVEKNCFKLKITLYYEHRGKPKLAQIMSDASLDIMFFKAEKDEDFFAEVHVDLENIQVPLEEIIPSPSTNQDQQQKQKQQRQQQKGKQQQQKEQQPCFSDVDQTCYTLNPGPLIPDLLFLHQEHRAHALFHGTMDECQLKVRRCDSNFWQLVDDIPERVMCHIRVAGFEGVFRCGHIQINHALITALVERWRPETHTFHFPTGEATVTLQDVQVLWGLQVDGDAVCWIDQSKTLEEWIEFCRDMMGFTPPVGAINKSRIYLRYICDVLRTPLAVDASEEDCLKRARVYIMHMLGGNLLSDLSSSSVYLYLLTNLRTMTMSGQQSWGSAILACLYRRLCKASSYKTTEICGPLMLLQLWAWERLPTIRPIRLCDQIDFTRPYGARWNVGFGASQVSHVLTAYRDRLASLRPDQFVWVPYNNYVLEKLPAYCRSGHAIWRSVTYLVCWEIVEPHLPNRVLRQFGMEQPIPISSLLENHAALHKLTRAGRNNVNWMDVHRQYIDHWQCRLQHVENSTVINDPTCASVEYMTWYWQRTVMYITNPSKNAQLSEGHQGNGGTAEFLMDGLCRVYHKLVDLMGVSDSRHAKYLAEIRDITSYYMQQTKGHQRMQVRSSHVIEQDSHRGEPPPQTQRTPRTVTRTRKGGRRRYSEIFDVSSPDAENEGPPLNVATTRQRNRRRRSEVFDVSSLGAESEGPSPRNVTKTRQGGRRRRSEVFDASTPYAENEGPSSKRISTTSLALVHR